MISVIIPTMFIPKGVTELVKKVASHPLVGEVILIDNTEDDIIHITEDLSDKVLYIKEGRNTYVNPAWNKGASMAQEDKLMFLNDDIDFDTSIIDFIHDHITEDKGIIGIGNGTLPTCNPVLAVTNELTYGFACLFFIHKKSYIKIPNELKIWFGDNYLLEKGKQPYKIINYKFGGEISKTVNLPKLSPIIEEDKKVWERMKNPKIQLIHISTTPELEKCTKSKELLHSLEPYMDIKYISNPVYKGEVDLSTYRWKANLGNVRPAHYGCYLAHMQALTEIDKEYDYTIVMEEDGFISSTIPEFIEILHKAIKECVENDVYYVNFGAYKTLQRLKYNDDFDEAWHQIAIHCYLIPNKRKEWYMTKIKENPWDGPDLWYNHIFCHERQKRLVSKKLYSDQISGPSVIDNVYKEFKNQPMYENLKKTDAIKANYNSTKEFVKKEIEENNVYEKYFPIEEGDVVVDIGAHVGIFSRKYAPIASKLYALEPDPLFFEELSTIPNVTAINAAIASKNGTSLIQSDGHFHDIGEGDTTINTITFDKFLKDNEIDKIDFLKVDCEGGEYDVFTKENIAWIKNNVKKVAGEIHIHSDKHRVQLPYMLFQLEENGIRPIFTSQNGILLTKEHILSKLDYYREILFFFRIDKGIDMPEPVYMEPVVNYNYVNGCFVELINWPIDKKYLVEFKNKDTGNVLYSTLIENNCWTRCSYEYYVNWQIVISLDGDIKKTIDMDLTDARVLIGLGSSSLGDSLAWMPYMEEFRKKHKCHVIACTHMNFLFKEQYPELEWVEPGVGVPNLQAQYSVGWYYKDGKIDYYKHPINPRPQPMQKTASDILGLEFEEVKPLIKLPEVKKRNTITIGFHSTAQVKYWNNRTGWQDVVNHINGLGMTPLILSREQDGHMRNWYPDGALQLPPGDISKVIRELCASKLYIGVGSGLSWLAWACGVPVILISGFSEPYTEMQPQPNYIRIGAPEGVSSGCFNKYKFDPADWMWYEPSQLKGTDRQFECSKLIKSETVIAAVDELLNIKN